MIKQTTREQELAKIKEFFRIRKGFIYYDTSSGKIKNDEIIKEINKCIKTDYQLKNDFDNLDNYLCALKRSGIIRSFAFDYCDYLHVAFSKYVLVSEV